MRAYFPSFGQLQNELSRLHGDMNRMFGRAGSRAGWANSSYPSVNIWEDDDKYFVEAELPGFDREALDISVNEGNRLSLKGERKQPEIESGDWHRNERGYGSFSREFTLSGKVNSATVSAAFDNGILLIELPKAEEDKPRKIEVKASDN
jgi:HSP20 family protein